MRSAIGILLTSALLGAGCGSDSSSAGEFEGDQRAVAEVVEEIQDAGQRRDAAKLCRDLLTRELREKIASGGTSCDKEMQKAVKDAGAFELEVEKVTVTGTAAQAVVRGTAGEAERVRTLRFVKEDGRWRAASFG